MGREKEQITKGRQTDTKERKEKKKRKSQSKTAVETSLLSEFRMDQDLEADEEGESRREEDQHAAQLPTQNLIWKKCRPWKTL